MTTTSIIGFDSAWTDQVKAPGAVSIIRVIDGRPREFVPPRLSSFPQALAIIETEQSHFDRCFVALDQPTIVPNATGSRPVDKVAASVISWLGGGGPAGQPVEEGHVRRRRAGLGIQECTWRE